MFANPFKLKKLGILGMNERNINFIGKYNDRKNFPLVDNKLNTKQIALKHNIAVPELLGYIEFQADRKNFEKLIENENAFVIKPAHGSGGKGILVVKRENDEYVKTSTEVVNTSYIRRHISNILSGLYSLGGRNDIAVFEKMVTFDEVFDGFSFEGVPDIRMIVYRGYPTMAMIRLSTSMSDGKANLHQGAVGVGLDMATGKAISAVQFNRPLSYHPDTQKKLDELVVPMWDEILRLSAKCYEMTDMGYFGADIVIDKYRGPLVLELNARPGLAIQIANDNGLLNRFTQIDQVAGLHKTLESKVEFSKSLTL